VQVNNDFKLENEPLLDAQNKNRTLNCGISYEYIKSDFKFLFEVPLFYINRISTRDFYLFPTSEEYDKTDSIIFLNLKNSLENKNLYNYFYISEILKKLEMYFQFMKILFGNHTEKVINALNEEVKNFSDLQGDFHDLMKNKDNQTLKWYVVNEFFYNNKSFKNRKMEFTPADFFNRQKSEMSNIFNFFVPVNSFDIENPQDRYSKYLDTSHDGIYLF
jgi:hypothetical protein